MDDRARVFLVFPGVIVLLLGLVAGFPYSMAIGGELAAEPSAWRMAHLEGILNGLVLLGVAAAGGLLTLSDLEARIVKISLLVAGYGNIVAAVAAASFGVRGLSPEGPAANFAVFVVFTAAVFGVLIGLGVVAVGAWRSRAA